MNTESVKESLYSGIWGTIGPKFNQACDMLNKKFENGHSILTHSATTAYEAALRSLDAGYGDLVLCAAYSDRMDAEIPASIGAAPVFADIDGETFTLTPQSVQNVLSTTDQIKVLTVDYSESLDLDGIKRVCREHSCALILNAGSSVNAGVKLDGIHAVIFDLGVCGAAVTDKEDTYLSLFAWHHCGHSPGTTESFTFGTILGGDMRVSEWQAIEAMEIMKGSSPAVSAPKKDYILAYENPAFRTDYFRKMTGFRGDYRSECYPNAQTAADNIH